MADMSWKDGIVRAGATQPAYVKEEEGRHPELFFRFRVKDPTEVEATHSRIQKKFEEVEGAGVKAIQDLLIEVLTEWSLKDALSPANIKLLRHPLMMKVYTICIQAGASDPIPDQYLENKEGGIEEQLGK